MTTMIKPNWLDRAVSQVSPTWGARRLEARMRSEFCLSSYNSAVSSRRNALSGSGGGTGDWHITAGDLWKIREKCRDLERNNCIFRGILKRLDDNVISTGIGVQATTEDKDWNKEAEYLFADFADDAGRCDLEGKNNHWQQQRLVFHSAKRDGDILALWVNVGNDEAGIQLLEGDRLASPPGASEENIINGVRLDERGRPAAFWITDKPTLGPYAAAGGSWKDAEHCLFITNERDRVSQTRGVPAFASNLNIFEDVDQVLEAELLAFKINSCFAFFWGREQHLWPTQDTQTQPSAYGGTDYLERISPGQIVKGSPNDIAQAVESRRPGPMFYEGLKAFFRIIGLNHGLPLQMTLLDFSETSWSAHRSAILEARRGFVVDQKRIGIEFVRPVYWRKIWDFIQAGELGYPKTDNPERDWERCRLQYPTWPWTDPEADTKANAVALATGQKTYMDIAEENGVFWEDLLDQRVREMVYLRDAAVKAKLDPALFLKTPVPGFGEKGRSPERKPMNPDKEPEEQEDEDATTNAA